MHNCDSQRTVTARALILSLQVFSAAEMHTNTNFAAWAVRHCVVALPTVTLCICRRRGGAERGPGGLAGAAAQPAGGVRWAAAAARPGAAAGHGLIMLA